MIQDILKEISHINRTYIAKKEKTLIFIAYHQNNLLRSH